MPADVTGQKNAKGESGNLTLEQQANLVLLLHSMSQARKTAGLAFAGQTVKLHQEFPGANHDDRSLAAELGRANIILASVQTAVNLPAMKLKGWTDADTQAFSTVRGTFPGQEDRRRERLHEGDRRQEHRRRRTERTSADHPERRQFGTAGHQPGQRRRPRRISAGHFSAGSSHPARHTGTGADARDNDASDTRQIKKF